MNCADIRRAADLLAGGTMEKLLRALADVVEVAAQANTAHHSDQQLANCPLCDALGRLEAIKP